MLPNKIKRLTASASFTNLIILPTCSGLSMPELMVPELTAEVAAILVSNNEPALLLAVIIERFEQNGGKDGKS